MAMDESYPSLKQILQNIEQVVWIIDSSTGEIQYVNPAFEVVWGRSRKALYTNSLTLIESVHPEDRVKVMSANLDDTHRSLNQVYRIIRPDSSLRWISARTFLMNEDTTGAAYEVCVAQDITAQNEVDQTLRKALDRSREQASLSRRMSLTRKPEAVLKTLMSASELRTAKSAFVLFFESPQHGPSHDVEVIAAWLSASPPDDFYPYETLIESSLLENLAAADLIQPSKPVIVSYVEKDQRLTLEVRTLLNELQIQTVAIFPLVALGNWLGFLFVVFPQEKHFESIELRHIKILVDQAAITLHNLQLLEIEAESRHEAERANEIKTEFLAMISHELRTPLTSIIGFTTTLLADDVSWEPDEERDFIQTIQQEADRLQELINHLLDLSRLEAGMLPISLEVHSLQEIVEDALPQFNSLTGGQSILLHLPSHLPPVNVDAKRIAQVLVNLVRNAATYAPKGSEISISASVRAGFMQINVKDQGPGIPAVEHRKVFKAFQRGKNIDNVHTQGAGLGLAVCKGLVEAHGGRIWIKKKNTPGATISFTIPLVPSLIPVISSEEEQ